MDDGSTALDLTLPLWALICQHTSAGVKYAHTVRDSHDGAENQAQSQDSQWFYHRVSHVSFNPNQGERVMHGRIFSSCSVRSHSSKVCRFLIQSQPQFIVESTWIWLILSSDVIQTSLDEASPWFIILFPWHSVTLSDSRSSPALLSVSVPVYSASVTACESSGMSSDARCVCRCQDANSAAGEDTCHHPLIHFTLIFYSFSTSREFQKITRKLFTDLLLLSIFTFWIIDFYKAIFPEES